MTKICSVKGCDRIQESKKYCLAHYKRYKKHGNPLIGGELGKRQVVKSHRYIEIDGVSIPLTVASKKYGISGNLIWIRYTKLGWTARQAVGLDDYAPKTSKGITYKGRYFPKQEELYQSVKDKSPRSITTMRIAMARLRKSEKVLTDELIEEALFGSWVPEDDGGYLYRLTCLPTQKIYIGITSRPVNERWKAHVSEANSGVNSPLKVAIREFGPSKFKVETLNFFQTAKQLKAEEKKEILHHNSIFPFGLNSNAGGTLGGIDRIPTWFEGKRYKSLSALARSYGLEPGLVKSRINQDGLTLENAIKLGPPIKGGRRNPRVEGSAVRNSPWVVDGVEYSTLAELGKRFGISAQRIAVRLSAGWELSEALRPLPTLNCASCGASFLAKKKDQKFCSIKCKDRQRGGKKKRALNAGEGYRNTTYIDGVRFNSDSEVERVFGVNRQRFRVLINKGLTPEAAIKMLKQGKDNS